MTKSEIISKVVKRTALSTGEASAALEAIVATIKEEVKGGGEVTIRGFGVFSVKHKAAKMGYSFHAGKQIEIPAKDVVVFKPSLEFQILPQ
jgi:DNA-binding protein HU-beta